YRDLQSRAKCIPVMITGNQLTTVGEGNILKKCHDAFAEQYDKKLLEAYKQLPREKRVVIIDDLDHSRLSKRKGYKVLIEILRKHFGRIVAIADDLFQFEELMTDGERSLFQVDRFSILPLSRRQRGQIIENWHDVGAETSGAQRVLDQG